MGIQRLAGILIIAGSLLVVSQIDNLIRPRLVAEDAYLNPALVLLSAFGGLAWFGFLGVIYGPIIAIFFVTTIEIYLTHYQLSDSKTAIETFQDVVLEPIENKPSKPKDIPT